MVGSGETAGPTLKGVARRADAFGVPGKQNKDLDMTAVSHY
jgi:hypothetical protein